MIDSDALFVLISLFLLHFEVICDLLGHRCMTTRNILVKYLVSRIISQIAVNFVRTLLDLCPCVD